MKETKDLHERRELGKRIRAYRNAAGITQTQLAEAIGKQQPYIGPLEKGERNMGLDLIAIISKCFGVKWYQLADPDYPVPDEGKLRENVSAYMKSRGIDTTFVDNRKSPNYTKYLTLYVQSDALHEPKSAYQIKQTMKIVHDSDISSSQVTNILTKMTDQLIITKRGRENLYQLKRKKKPE